MVPYNDSLNFALRCSDAALKRQLETMSREELEEYCRKLEAWIKIFEGAAPMIQRMMRKWDEDIAEVFNNAKKHE